MIQSPGERIETIGDRHLPPSDICFWLGLSRQQYRSLVAGEHPIGKVLARRLQETVGCTQEDWLRWEEEYRGAIATD